MDFKKLKLKRTTKRWKAIDTLFGLLSRQGKLGLCWKNFFHLVFLMFIALTFVSITKYELSVWYCLTTTTTTSTTAKFALSLWRRCHHLWLCLVVSVLLWGAITMSKDFESSFQLGDTVQGYMLQNISKCYNGDGKNNNELIIRFY